MELNGSAYRNGAAEEGRKMRFSNEPVRRSSGLGSNEVAKRNPVGAAAQSFSRARGPEAQDERQAPSLAATAAAAATAAVAAADPDHPYARKLALAANGPRWDIAPGQAVHKIAPDATLSSAGTTWARPVVTSAPDVTHLAGYQPSVSLAKRTRQNAAVDVLSEETAIHDPTEQVSRPEKKRDRERKRREVMNDKFNALSDLLRSSGSNSEAAVVAQSRVVKEAILADAISYIRQMNQNMEELRSLEQARRDEIRDLRAEKVELRADKNSLRIDRDDLVEENKRLRASINTLRRGIPLPDPKGVPEAQMADHGPTHPECA